MKALVRRLALAGLLISLVTTALADGAPAIFVLGQVTGVRIQSFGCYEEKVAAIFTDTVYRSQNYNHLSEDNIKKYIEEGRCKNFEGYFYVEEILVKGPQAIVDRSGRTGAVSMLRVIAGPGKTMFLVTEYPVIGEPTSDDYLERVIGK